MHRLTVTLACVAALVGIDAGFGVLPASWTHRVDQTCTAVPKPWMGYADPVRLIADFTARVLHVPAIKRHPEGQRALTASCAARRGWFRPDPDTIVVVKSFPRS